MVGAIEAELQELGLTGAPETVLFVYDEAGHLIGEYREDGTPVREIVYLNDTPVAVNTAKGLHYIHTDHLGTPRAISEPGGPVIWRWVGDPFGIGEAANDPDGDGEEFIYRGRFPGQHLDAETGLHYNYHRYYDPATGTYMTSDPIGLEGGPNTYLYAQANPLRFSDPLGLLSGKPEIPDWFPPPTFPETLDECQTQKQEAIVKKCLVISNVREKVACIDAWRDWELSCIGERACSPDDSKSPS